MELTDVTTSRYPTSGDLGQRFVPPLLVAFGG
jgi:hypothetical protein